MARVRDRLELIPSSCVMSGTQLAYANMIIHVRCRLLVFRLTQPLLANTSSWYMYKLETFKWDYRNYNF